MNKTCLKGFFCAVGVCLLALLSIQPGECQSSPDLFTDQELDDLLAPIALYPDPLLAEILPASTYPEDVADAAAWLAGGGDPSRIDEQNWGDSVKAVAHYPEILSMMSGDMDWTADVGDAFLNQPEDVTNSIQRLRWRAKSLGNLVSNEEQTVDTEGDYIEVLPVQPQYIYVPQYDPAVVYVRRPALGAAPFITFRFRLAIGGWLSMDFDWYNHHVIYHGWNRHGWVNNARPYVHITNVYINRNRPYIQQTWRHDPSRRGPERYWASRPSPPHGGRYARIPEARGRARTPPGPSRGMFGYKRDAQASSNRGRQSLAGIRPPTTTQTPRVSQAPTRPGPTTQKPAAPIPGPVQRPAMPTPGVSQAPKRPGPTTQQPAAPIPSTARGPATPAPGVRQAPTRPGPAVTQHPAAPAPAIRPQPPMPAPSAGGGISQPGLSRRSTPAARVPSGAFGGYRGANEARAQSLRGQASRQSSVGAPSPPPPAPAPAGRGSAPAGKTAPKGKPGPKR